MEVNCDNLHLRSFVLPKLTGIIYFKKEVLFFGPSLGCKIVFENYLCPFSYVNNLGKVRLKGGKAI